ncbi:hypothetical protein TYRP_005402 [Tyrophagus putrescentiae]|nr:hypothetical protein TYRP_005402 [Tyrophagus putrescentiae]
MPSMPFQCPTSRLSDLRAVQGVQLHIFSLVLFECRAKLVAQEESYDLLIKLLLGSTTAFAFAFLVSSALALRLQWKLYHFVKPEIPHTADPSMDTGVVNLSNTIDPAHDHY